MDNEIQNMSAWIQEILRSMQDIRTQIIDMRGEQRGQLDDIRGHLSRVEQTAIDNSKHVQSIHSSQDVTRGDVNNAQTTLENKIGHLDSKLDSVHSTVKEVRNKIR